MDWGNFIKIYPEEGKDANPPLTNSLFSYIDKNCWRSPSNQAQLTEARFLSKHTGKSRQYYQCWEAKSRMLSASAVAMELLNARETKTAAVPSPPVARSCCSCCAQSLGSISQLWRPVTAQLPALFPKLSSHWVSLGFTKKSFPSQNSKASCSS